MKPQLIKVLAIVLPLFCSSFVNAVPLGGLGTNSNFFDNGIVTTEYRADGTVWEWLDLTATNGITFDDIQLDLDDDGELNNSITGGLNGGLGALADVTSLSTANQAGWQTVSNDDVVSMFNSFFGLSLVDGDNFQFNSNETIVEVFIELFGDTFHESVEDAAYPMDPGTLSPFPFSGYAAGATNSDSDVLPGSLQVAEVYDGHLYFFFDPTDFEFDAINTGFDTFSDIAREDIGTWLTREVTSVPVPEPASFALFGIALFGSFLSRKRNR